MKNVIFISCLLHFILLSVKAIVQEGHVNSYYKASDTSPFDYTKLNDLIVFGDSYSTVSTNFDDMTYTGNNKSGGKNWPLHLISMYDMYLWNFAWGGAPITNNYILKEKHQYPLDTQYEIFKSKMSEIKEFSDWKGESTLFAFWFGINDITKTSWTIEETIIEGLNHLIKVLNECYEEGARNYLIFNIPPFDKSPEEFNVENVSLFITKFNNGIERKVKEFSLSNPEANVILYNSFDELECILMNHDKYNITDIKNEYVQNRKKNPYTFYWNNGCHPSEKVQQYLTEDLHNYLNSISVNKTPEINNSTVKASSHLIQTNGVNKFNIELSHSLFSIIIFYIIFIFF